MTLGLLGNLVRKKNMILLRALSLYIDFYLYLTATVIRSICACACACVRVCLCVSVCCMCNLSSKRAAASTSTNLTTSVCRDCPELKSLAPAMDAETIKLAGQVLRMISINCVIDKTASKLWIQWYLSVCTKLLLQCVNTYYTMTSADA